ncbi:hypothetical protein ACP4OV_019303 [Aristida adscensionis]
MPSPLSQNRHFFINSTDGREGGINQETDVMELAQVSTLVITLNRSCCRCFTKIRKTLCKLQDTDDIQAIFYDERSGTVTISGPFDPLVLPGKLRRKAGCVIRDIQLKERINVQRMPGHRPDHQANLAPSPRRWQPAVAMPPELPGSSSACLPAPACCGGGGGGVCHGGGYTYTHGYHCSCCCPACAFINGGGAVAAPCPCCGGCSGIQIISEEVPPACSVM